MNFSPNTRLIRLALLASFTLFACNLFTGGSTTDPTQPAPPTDVPVQPTDIPAEPTQAPEPTNAPIDTTSGSGGIDVIEVNSYLDSFDTWNIIGLVQNNTSRFIDNVELEVVFFDAEGNEVYTDITYTDLYYLGPGEVSSFEYYLYEDVADLDTYEVSVVGNSVVEIDRAQPEVLNTRIAVDDYGDVHVTGEIYNTSDRPVQINSLSSATYGADGLLQTAGTFRVSVRYLDPGDVGPFRITMSGRGESQALPSSYDVFIDAEYVEPLLPYDIIIGDAIYYIDTFDALHLVGEVTNTDDIPLSLTLIAGIYDSSGVVIDAADATLAFSAIEPGETQPYDFEYWAPINYIEDLVDLADSYTIQVDAYWTWDTTIEYVEITTQNDDNVFDDFGGEFYGQVVNDSGETLDYIVVMIYLVDVDTDEVIATSYTVLFEELAPGGVADYSVYMNITEDFAIDSAEYYIVVKGERP